MRISLIVDPRCGSDSSQAPGQRRLILTPNKYRKSAVRPSGMGELQGANTRSSKKNRSNKKETAHTTHNSHFMSSVAISVQRCLHWCSHRHLASMLAPVCPPWMLSLQLAAYMCAIPHARRFQHHEGENRNGLHCTMGVNP